MPIRFPYRLLIVIIVSQTFLSLANTNKLAALPETECIKDQFIHTLQELAGLEEKLQKQTASEADTFSESLSRQKQILRKKLIELTGTWPGGDQAFIPFLETQLVNYPNAPLLIRFLGEACMRQRNYSRSIILFKNVLQYQPADLEVHLLLARTLELSDAPEEALRVYQTVAEHDVTNESVIQRCIHLARKTGQLESLAQRWDMLVRFHNEAEYDFLKRQVISLWHDLGRNDRVQNLLE